MFKDFFKLSFIKNFLATNVYSQWDPQYLPKLRKHSNFLACKLITDYLFNGKHAFRLLGYPYNQLYNLLVSLVCFFWPLTELVGDKPAHKLHEYIRHMLIYLSERFTNNQLEICPQQNHNYSHLFMDKEMTYNLAMLTVINHPVREPKNLTLWIIRILWIQ